jgi:hypothetical protein
MPPLNILDLAVGLIYAENQGLQSNQAMLAALPAALIPSTAGLAVTAVLANQEAPGAQASSGQTSSGTTSAPGPVVAQLSPSAGPLAGNTSVTITGSGFDGATAVDFGTVPATSYTVVSDTEITAVSPAAGPAAVVDVRVTTSGGTSPTSPADQFTYSGVPMVMAVVPDVGPAGGTSTVMIVGLGLTDATAVDFGPTPASSFTVMNDQSITATSPPGSGTVNVTVTTPGGTSTPSTNDRFTYAQSPVIASVAPSAGPLAGGTSVTITGSGFTGATGVAFGAVQAASYTVVSDTQITVASPGAAVAATVDVTITTPGGASATSASDKFSYIQNPAVATISPSAGPEAGGTLVVITGVGFTGATSVLFGAISATGHVVASDTEIVAVSPAAAQPGAVDVTVTTPLGTSAIGSGDEFTYALAPSVKQLKPNHGPSAGGECVNISGANLAGATSVMFGQTAAQSFSVVSATDITAYSPAVNTPGPVDVIVTTPGGSSAAGHRFTFNSPSKANAAVMVGPALHRDFAVGDVLRVESGPWDALGSVDQPILQWHRDQEHIPGADAWEYTVTEADEGHILRVEARLGEEATGLTVWVSGPIEIPVTEAIRRRPGGNARGGRRSSAHA